MATKDPRRVTREDHLKIQKVANLQGTEDYAVTVQKGKPDWVKTTHVFSRRPMLSEINAYEQTASQVRFKGQQAHMEGSQIKAGVTLYNLLIARTYDVPVGLKVIDQMNREESLKQVDPMIKREAIREFIGEVYSASRMEEALGGAEEDPKADDDLEGHTSDEPQDSEP